MLFRSGVGEVSGSITEREVLYSTVDKYFNPASWFKVVLLDREREKEL